jgi:phosphotransferase system HPr-like phosphotransfer protein
MGKKFTKTIKGFNEKGFYNPETYIITGSKDSEETNILDILSLIAKDGQEISIAIKQEDSIEDIEE